MTRMFALIFPIALASASFADTDDAQKQAECGFQANLMGAIQQARLDRVRKDRVSDKLLEQNPDWPEGVATALPAAIEYVYGNFKRRDLKNVDLAADTLTTCLENYDQIQSLKNSVSN